ncbi:SDR family oxidoreductase [Zestomonas carbonaria]|uniref:2-(R)-hydroxypropyl-CoM dehydrogenase n=1 Tax=Zestomonas carbonaria TaxID=2762745 RepID=A0A7U7EJC6_9GAMM|nr:SDR family oxidoreductase [Pseudomonas carbonaria]CAD5106124.1 2-(R)-hydroxypropyl-CoM dehydrogenase [Pseudomonas carbonaria]
MKTVLITGCSSGYGLETARHFLANGWKVIATMRKPDAGVLPSAENLRILPLDVTSEESIAAAVAAAGPIDALVNNAGIGVVGAFEATPLAHIKKVFDTNTFGVMAMCQAVIPQMRERRSGVIVNVTSTVTMKPFPLAAAYKASKQAIDGFTQSLADEMAYFGIRTKMVEPGYAPTTRFTVNNSINPQDLIPEAYAGFAAPIFAEFGKPQMTTKESDVAQAVWAAVQDTSGQLRFPAGEDAIEFAKHRAV